MWLTDHSPQSLSPCTAGEGGGREFRSEIQPEKKGKMWEGVLKFGFISHYLILIWLIINYINITKSRLFWFGFFLAVSSGISLSLLWYDFVTFYITHIFYISCPCEEENDRVVSVDSWCPLKQGQPTTTENQRSSPRSATDLTAGLQK